MESAPRQRKSDDTELTTRRKRGRPVSEEKKRQLIDAAVDEFAEHGFARASMERIALRAGISKRTLYNHHTSKEALFAVLVEEVVARQTVPAAIPYEPGRPLRAQLLAYAKGYRQLVKKRSNLPLMRMVLAEHIRAPARTEPLLKRYQASEYGFLLWIRAACADGRLREDPVKLTHLLQAMLRSVVLWPALLGTGGRSGRTFDNETELVIDMFLTRFQVQ